MDYFGNIFNAAGEFTGTDYYHSQAWSDSVAVAAQQDAAAAAVRNSEAAFVAGTGSQAAVTAAYNAVSKAITASHNLSEVAAQNSEGSHLAPGLTGGSVVFSEPVQLFSGAAGPVLAPPLLAPADPKTPALVVFGIAAAVLKFFL